MTTTIANPDPDLIDPLVDVYAHRVTDPSHARESIAEHRAALLVIDVQYLDAARGEGVFKDAAQSGVPLESQEYYFNQLEQTVLPNIRRAQDAFRARGLEVIHTRIMSLTKDGRDRSPGHKRLGLHAAPGSREAQFLEQVAPADDEIVVNKTASGVFTSTNLEFVLRNLQVTAIFVCGVYTNECVSTTVRDASDLGFFTTLIEDACTTVTPQLQENTINVLRDRYARIRSTQQVVAELRQLLPLPEAVVPAS
jgi:nicotinamidase-related amidase